MPVPPINTIDLNPAVLNIQGHAGADVRYTASFPFDTGAAAHELRIAATATGEAIETLTDEDGLEVDVDDVTTSIITLPKAFTAEHAGKLFFEYWLLGLNDIDRPYIKGTITLTAGITAETP